MSSRYCAYKERLVRAIRDGEGFTDPVLRDSVKRAAAEGGDESATGDGVIPAALGPYLKKVSRQAYRVTDLDIETLKKRGYSEDAIFELTVSAAVGAGLGRLERGLAALDSWRLEQSGAGHEA